MLKYRNFLNTDPPLLVEIWNQQAQFRGQVAKVSTAILDHHVFSKLYFDAAGLILAIEQQGDREVPLGFVHAGFTVNADLSDLDHRVGIICQLKVVPGQQQQEVAKQLLTRAVDYLESNGAEVVHGGSHFPMSPFYLGLYGGSRIPGLMVDDVMAIESLTQFGFSVDDKIIVMERQLSDFRTIVDRSQMMLRRNYQINAVSDPAENSWWESCTLDMAERNRFSVYHKRNQNVCGQVSYWDIQPLASSWGVVARGLYGLKVNEDLRRSGVATYLVGESLRYLMQQGIGVVEAQAPESHHAALGVFRKLGFEEKSQGLLLSMKCGNRA